MFGRNKDKSTQTVNLTVSNRTVVRVLLLVVATMVGLAAIQKASHSLVLIFTALFLALALNAPVHWLAQRLPGKRKGSRTVATAISFFVIIGLLLGFVASIVPPLVRQTDNFIAAAPGIIEDAKSGNSDIGRFIRQYNLEDQVQKFSDDLGDRLKGAGSAAVSTAGKVGSSVFSVLTILVLTFMMLIEGPRWLRLFRDIIPDEHHDRIDHLASGMYKVVKGYVNGQVILAALAALLITPIFFILDVSYPIALMVIVFICGLIPMVGHTIGAIFVTLVALFTSPWAALVILCYYFLYQQIENYLVQPRIQANSTNMSPLLVFTSVIVGVSFGGIFGGLVAIPVAGCVRIALLDYLQRKQIIDRDHDVADLGKADKKAA
ncbi:MAG TPA: AI-2E family transporter [Candidatus Saccharimonadales bacterium]|nr:AI-2E family transporter [Candidatus Saccharimonadales bacterium]